MTFRALTAGDLSRMQTTQQAAMMDEGVLLTYTTGAQDDHGMPVESWVEGATVACGVNLLSERDVTSRNEVMGETEVVMIDGRLRLPIGTNISNHDRIRIAKRFGVALATPKVFEFVGDAKRGPTGLVVGIKRAVDGAT